MKILIAEDEKSIAEVYQIHLESRGHRVLITNDGTKCIQEFRSAVYAKSRYDAVVLDYRMPGLDGLGTAKEILRISPKQRIIFASAYAEDTLFESTKELKMFTEILQKPFDPDVLAEIIESKEIYEQLKAVSKDRQKLDDWNLSQSEVQDLLGKVILLKRSEVELKNNQN